MAIVINSTTGEIDLDQTAPGTYVVTYTVQGVSSTQEVTVNAVDNATFSYSASSYEPTDADPTPTITGLTGGTFSGTTGLVINSTTGEIDLSASTVASHTITYDTTSSGSSVCPNTSTQTVEIAVAGIANNYSMNFDGTNDLVNIFSGSTPSTFQNIGNATSDYTISFWFKTTDSTVFTSSNTQWYGSDHIIELRGRYNSGNYNVPFNISAASNIGIGRGIGNYTSGGFVGRIASTTQGLNDNNWHHVAITVTNNGTPIIYIDNSVSTNTGLPSSWSSLTGVDTSVGSGTADLQIGARSTNAGSPVNLFNGQIDEVAIWNTALTSTQIQSIYDATGTNLTKDLTTVSGSNLKYWNRMGD